MLNTTEQNKDPLNLNVGCSGHLFAKTGAGHYYNRVL